VGQSRLAGKISMRLPHGFNLLSQSSSHCLLDMRFLVFKQKIAHVVTTVTKKSGAKGAGKTREMSLVVFMNSSLMKRQLTSHPPLPDFFVQRLKRWALSHESA